MGLLKCIRDGFSYSWRTGGKWFLIGLMMMFFGGGLIYGNKGEIYDRRANVVKVRGSVDFELVVQSLAIGAGVVGFTA